MRVLLAQLSPAPGEPATNVATVAGGLENDPEADLAIFPELFISGFDPATAACLTLAADDRRFSPIAEVARARHIAVLVGLVEQLEGGLVNAVACAANTDPYGPEQHLLVRADALESSRPHIYVNRVGEQAGQRFVGGSLVAAADGGDVISVLCGGPTVRCVEFDAHVPAAADLDHLSQVRSDLPVRLCALAPTS